MEAEHKEKAETAKVSMEDAKQAVEGVMKK